jgi:molecular chaperone DnaK
MEDVLNDAQLTGWDQIDKTLLVGGSTRMKAIAALVEEVTGKKPSMELHPDEVVAQGAALQGALLAVQKGIAEPGIARGLPSIDVQDVNSHSMGIISVKEDRYHTRVNSIILKKDTPIPCEVSDVFVTLRDQQAAVHVEVTQGEETNPDDVTIVGEGTMQLPPYPKGSPIKVTFKYDIDGLIHVVVFDLTANRLLGELQIERKANLNEGEVQAMQKQIDRLAIN